MAGAVAYGGDGGFYAVAFVQWLSSSSVRPCEKYIGGYDQALTLHVNSLARLAKKLTASKIESDPLLGSETWDRMLHTIGHT